MEKTSNGARRTLAVALSMWATVGCEPSGPRHDPADTTAVTPKLTARDPVATSGGAAARPSAATAQPSAATAQPGAAAARPSPSAAPRCVAPLAEPPPPVATPAARCPADPDGPLSLPAGAVRFTDAPSAPRVTVERALDDTARARGLMYRTRLDADAGMIFTWDDETPRSFWMRNTCIPLDMLFIASDGTIVGILEQVPVLNTQPRGVPCGARHVLEVNAGWTREHGVKPGQKVELET